MKKLIKLRKFLKIYKLDGYLVPKNDEYFNEYVNQSSDRLKFISNFSGSAGFAIILKNKNYLFVDGRYTIQARIQSGKNFTIITIPQKFPKDVLKTKKKLKIGFDPKNTFICNIGKFRQQNPTTIGVAWWSRLSK